MFDGDETKYELWETKVLGHLHLIGLKTTVLGEPNSQEQRAADVKKNADAYAEMIQLLDDKSLSLIMRDAGYYHGIIMPGGENSALSTYTPC